MPRLLQISQFDSRNRYEKFLEDLFSALSPSPLLAEAMRLCLDALHRGAAGGWVGSHNPDGKIVDTVCLLQCVSQRAKVYRVLAKKGPLSAATKAAAYRYIHHFGDLCRSEPFIPQPGMYSRA